MPDQPINYRGGFWPNRGQENLLRAALLDGDEALRAWRAWRSEVDIEQLDPGSHRLLALLDRNLKNLAVDDPALPRIKGVYRQFWYRNQLLFHNMVKLVVEFQEAGIPVLVLKGVPLSLLYYRDSGVRPMADFDILIPPDCMNKALDRLRPAGWNPIYYDDFSGLTPSYLSFATSHSFRDGERREFDLHWYLFPFCPGSGCDRGLWERAVPLEIQGVSTRTLSAGDHLLHVLVHGAAWNDIPPIRWVADAVTILRDAPGPIDWDSVTAEAERHQVVLPLRATLNYLRKTFNAPVPENVLGKLESYRPGKAERLRFYGQTLPLDQRGPLLELRLLYHQYRCWRTREDVPPGFLTFLRTMQHTAKRRELHELGSYTLKRGLARLISRARGPKVF